MIVYMWKVLTLQQKQFKDYSICNQLLLNIL